VILEINKITKTSRLVPQTDGTPPLWWPTIFVTRMLTHKLFAVANLVQIIMYLSWYVLILILKFAVLVLVWPRIT